MKLKNYQEDIVLRAVEIALEDQPELLADDALVNDVAAYVLNRVPPRYVMSERGFLRLALEHMDEAQDESLANVIELMLLVNHGLSLVQTRRSQSAAPAVVERYATRLEGLDAPELPEYVHNYPQFVGRVVDSATGSPLAGATVSMYVDGDLAPPAAPGWQNPYLTSDATRGYFSFWPHAAASETLEHATEILFTVTHPDYAPFRHVQALTTSGSFSPDETIQGDGVVSLGEFRLSADPERA